jgi:cytochrome b subunit of formate dehydrogenase
MANDLKLNSIHKRYLLDEAYSPVGRFRLLSNGVNENTRLLNSSEVTGDCACLACGNCVDACPVVKHEVGLVFDQNQRTSMALENYVQEECRRCYRCVKSCPQVSKDLKEYTAGFRRVEKIVHLLSAFTIVSLIATGVILYHYAEVINSFEMVILKYIHRTIGVLSIFIPVLYYKLDISHFRRTVSNVFSWGSPDSLWLKNTWSMITKANKKMLIKRYEFNPGQKIWYLVIISLFPLIYISGWIAFLFGSPAESKNIDNFAIFHLIFVIPFDIMFLIHVYIKYVQGWIRDCFRIFKNYKKTKSFVFTRNLP